MDDPVMRKALVIEKIKMISQIVLPKQSETQL